MTQQRYSAQRDLTAALTYAIPTGPHLLLYLCGTSDKPHKGLRLGGEWVGKLRDALPDVRSRTEGQAMSNTHAALVQRLQDEADLCRNEGAGDIAALLEEAAAALAQAEAAQPVASVLTASDFEGRVQWSRPGHQPKLGAKLYAAPQPAEAAK